MTTREALEALAGGAAPAQRCGGEVIPCDGSHSTQCHGTPGRVRAECERRRAKIKEPLYGERQRQRAVR